MPAIFQPRIAKKINKALSVRVIVICSDHKLLIKVLVAHQHCLSLYCTRLLLLLLISYTLTNLNPQECCNLDKYYRTHLLSILATSCQFAAWEKINHRWPQPREEVVNFLPSSQKSGQTQTNNDDSWYDNQMWSWIRLESEKKKGCFPELPLLSSP